MCINFDESLPESVMTRIKAVAGRNRVMKFATRLIYVGRKALTEMLGYENPNQIAKYIGILEMTGVITRGNSYKAGRNGLGYYLSETVMNEMRLARWR